MDWDGDSRADLAVWDPSSGRWTIRASISELNEVVTLGKAGDIPVPGDYIGGAADEVAVFRPSTGEWLLRERGSAATTTVVWGVVGDQPVPADYDNDGKVELGVFRPSSGQWRTADVNLTNALVRTHGVAGDTAFAGNVVGSAEPDLVVFRRGTWHVKDGATAATSSVNTGGRIPVLVDWNNDGYQDLAFFWEEVGAWGILVGSQLSGLAFGEFGDIPIGR
jgi:hypothetical protein